jgi:hypothetical protein
LEQEHNEHSPYYYLNKYKVTTTIQDCRICGRNGYYYHPDLLWLCYTHLLDLLNPGEIRWKWSDWEKVWQTTERLLSRSPSGGVSTAGRAGFTRIVNMQLILDGLRLCSKCQVVKELEAFCINRASYDGYLIYCRECDADRRRELYYRKRGINE